MITSPDDLKKLPVNTLDLLADEIRDFLVKSISQTGGHLASNLGVVELTIALHYCFNTPIDKIIWDVGHQTYVHKILTGRYKHFNTLRKRGGLSGFPKASESLHDAFDTGHSSTSISAALGYAVTRDLSNEKYGVVSVIGDGSLTGGLAFEALNNAGRLNTNFIVILNDNQMSISENVGALSRYLNGIRTAPTYLDAKRDVNDFLKKIPVMGNRVGRALEKAKNSIRYMLLPGSFFEELGFTYVGPIDGHNTKELINVLNRVKKIRGPVLLHVYTVKGKGYANAEQAPCDYHGVDSFDIETGQPVITKIWDTYSDVFGASLIKLAHKDKRILAITAAMPAGTGLSKFAECFPDRIFDVGIAEAHAVTFAAGMAKNGFIPVVAIYSSFLQRAYDQIVHDVCMQNLHVVFVIDRAGIVGADGETHQGVFDLSFLTHIPNITIMSPKNKKEMQEMLKFAVQFNAPVAIRYPRSAASRVLRDVVAPIEHGKCEVIAAGEKILLISFGGMMDIAYEVYKMLQAEGFGPGLINARFAKPLDSDMIRLIPEYDYCFVIEENTGQGGLGACILQALSSYGLKYNYFRTISLPDIFIPHGSRSELLKEYGLDSEGVYKQIISTVRFDACKNQ